MSEQAIKSKRSNNLKSTPKRSRFEKLFQKLTLTEKEQKNKQRSSHEVLALVHESTDEPNDVKKRVISRTYSRSMSNLNTTGLEIQFLSADLSKDQPTLIDKPKTRVDSSGEVKLISPYGDWCAFTGGEGSGGCVITGPYESSVFASNYFSDQSFESTEETDAIIEHKNEPPKNGKPFWANEIVWAKRPGLPWFPGILLDPTNTSKETKELFKNIGASYPTKKDIPKTSQSLILHKTDLNVNEEKFLSVFLLDHKRTWLLLTENKLRHFNTQSEEYFLDILTLLTSKYKREMEKGYKKAKKMINKEK